MMGEVKFWPGGRSIKVKPGTTLLDAARRAGVAIQTRCGGKAACFMCKVNVRPESELMPMGEQEARKLGRSESSGTRLSCQARVAGDVEVDIPMDPLRAAVARQLAKQAEEEDKLW